MLPIQLILCVETSMISVDAQTLSSGDCSPTQGGFAISHALTTTCDLATFQTGHSQTTRAQRVLLLKIFLVGSSLVLCSCTYHRNQLNVLVTIPCTDPMGLKVKQQRNTLKHKTT